MTPEKLKSVLQELPSWNIESGKLRRDFKFKDFREAFSFMTAVALAAEKADHHPEWSNVYNRVRVDLVTHDAGNEVTDKDIALATVCDETALRIGGI